MKKTAITIAVLVAAALFMSCSDGGSSGSNDGSENQNPSAGGGHYICNSKVRPKFA